MALKLLLILADNDFRRHLVERMRLENYLVIEATPDGEAAEMVQRINFDVVLLGATGTHQGCLSLLKVIKEIRPFTEVILLTPLEEHSLYGSMQAMQLGAFDDLLIPLDVPALHRRIQEAYRSKRARVKAERSKAGAKRQNRCGLKNTDCRSSIQETREKSS